MRPRLAIVFAVACGLALALGILYRTPPEQNRLAPPCMFHKLTGLHCSGCGATRAVYALLHLHPGEALKKNILFVTFLPFLLFWGLRSVFRWVRGEKPKESGTLMSPRATLIVVSVIFAFAILRNLPWPPFTLLAPR